MLADEISERTTIRLSLRELRLFRTSQLRWPTALARFGPASALREGDVAGLAGGDCVECSSAIEVTFKRSGVTGNWNPSYGTLLDMAEGMGLSPPYSCRSGICQTCICSIEQGEVEYVEEPLDPPDDDAVLICCSKPKTDVVIDI